MPITRFPDATLDSALSGILRVYESAETPLATDGAATTLDINVPVGAVIVGGGAIITETVAGVSASGVTLTAAIAGGASASIGTLVSAGDGNVPAGTRVDTMFDNSVANAKVASSVADMTLTFSGGADNTPSAGAAKGYIIALVPYTDFS